MQASKEQNARKVKSRKKEVCRVEPQSLQGRLIRFTNFASMCFHDFVKNLFMLYYRSEDTVTIQTRTSLAVRTVSEGTHVSSVQAIFMDDCCNDHLECVRPD